MLHSKSWAIGFGTLLVLSLLGRRVRLVIMLGPLLILCGVVGLAVYVVATKFSSH